MSSDPKADSPGTGRFVQVITPLTGQDPNLGSFFLVVGIVTCVFIAVFQFTLPRPIAMLFTAGVLLVTILSAIVGHLLERLGHFDGGAAHTVTPAPEPTVDRVAWEPIGEEKAPLPPVLDFDAQLQTLQDEVHDGELPPVYDEFVDEYVRLKTARFNRRTITSDMRADLNPISVVYDDGSQGAEILDEISRRLFRYIDGESGAHLRMDDPGFFDDDGAPVAIEDVAGQVTRIRAQVHNDGDELVAESVIRFLNERGQVVGTDIKPVGSIEPGMTTALDTACFVPTIATDVDVTVRQASGAA